MATTKPSGAPHAGPQAAAPIRALAFGPDRPPQGQSVSVELRSRFLLLRDDTGREQEIAYAWLNPRGGGWNGDAVTLEWTEDGVARALSMHGQSLRALRAQAPQALQDRFALVRPQTRARSASPFWIAIAAFAVAAAVVVVLAVTQSHRLVDAAAARIPPSWEERLGEATLTAATAAHRRWPEGHATRLVQDLGSRLAAEVESPYTFRWILLESPQVNAMAAPGGTVIVFTGLVDRAGSPEELAGVLAHEVQHVVLRHSLRGLLQGLGWRALVAVVFGSSGDLGAPAAAWAERLGSLRFSRQQETEADIAGVELLRRAGIDPRGMADFFERLAQDQREPPAFLSTHPASEGRARAVRERLAGMSVPPPLAVDWAAVQAELENKSPR